MGYHLTVDDLMLMARGAAPEVLLGLVVLAGLLVRGVVSQARSSLR